MSRELVVEAAVALAVDHAVEQVHLVGDARVERHHLHAERLTEPAHRQRLDPTTVGVFAEIELPGPGTAWREGMRRRTFSLREAMRRRPWAVGQMEPRRSPGPATLRHHDAVLGSLRRSGCTVALAAHAFSLLASYLHGFAMQERTLPFTTADESAEVAAGIFTGTVPAGYPHLTELAMEHVMQPRYDYGDEFG